MASSSELTESLRKKPKQLGKYCIAGAPGKVSCKNNSTCVGISMHLFPKANEKLRNIWIKFVQRIAARGGIHLHTLRFAQRILKRAASPNGLILVWKWIKVKLEPKDGLTGMLTIDTVVPMDAAHEISMRKCRQVI